jgi:hypothetical protein
MCPLSRLITMAVLACRSTCDTQISNTPPPPSWNFLCPPYTSCGDQAEAVPVWPNKIPASTSALSVMHRWITPMGWLGNSVERNMDVSECVQSVMVDNREGGRVWEVGIGDFKKRELTSNIYNIPDTCNQELYMHNSELPPSHSHSALPLGKFWGAGCPHCTDSETPNRYVGLKYSCPPAVHFG